MDMFNKLKAKLADELDSESENVYNPDPRAPAGAMGGRPHAGDHRAHAEALETEVLELKEHINKNYFVYVKRLEKRKERVKELEEYAKLLVRDNDELSGKLRKFEECQDQLARARESLDELEGFQNQELGKVKHMLLSAETALDKENAERKRLEKVLQESGAKFKKNSSNKEAVIAKVEAEKKEYEWQSRMEQVKKDCESRVEEVTKGFEAKVSRLEERLGNQELTGDDRLEAVIKERDSLEKDLQRSRDEGSLLLCELRDTKSALERRDDTLTQSEAIVQSLRQERDVLKTSLLELEIANHEQQNTKKEDREKIKIECAKLTTEKETLEMTLDLRDKELKAKKEEYRKDLSVHEQRKLELEHDVESKCSRIGAVEAELLILKEKFSESSHNLTTAEADVANLENSEQCLESFVKERDSQLSALKGELEEERKTCFGSALALSELEDRFAEATSDNEKVVLELGEIAKRKEELEATCGESEAVVQKFKAKVGDLEERIKESEVTFDARVESSKLVRDMKKKLLEAEDDLADKKKIIKLHGQRIADIRKTLQKEMKTPATVSSSSSNVAFFEYGHSSTAASDRSGSTPTPPLLHHSPTPSGSFDIAQLVLSPSAGPPFGEIVTMTEVNFKYLKHVIFKFFTSREYEAKHLTRAISALLKFTPDEERLFHEHLEWKMSWFGAKPSLGSGQFSLSIDS